MDYRTLIEGVMDFSRNLFGDPNYGFAYVGVPEEFYRTQNHKPLFDSGVKLENMVFMSRSPKPKGHTQIHGKTKTVTVHINGRGDIQVSRNAAVREGISLKKYLMNMGASAKEATKAIRNSSH
tara:strand:+ start:12338 stop:12706 length:369 start_codon:yes stop_codon:yes gene_type:complete